MWPACDFMKVGMDKLRETGHAARYADEAVCFSDAGHNIGTLGLPTNDSMWATLGGATYALGGSPRANARAAREGDDKIRAFLARVAP